MLCAARGVDDGVTSGLRNGVSKKISEPNRIKRHGSENNSDTYGGEYDHGNNYHYILYSFYFMFFF